MTRPPMADAGKLEYIRPIHGGSLKGAYKIPPSAIVALGHGNREAGLAVCDEMFGHHLALGRGTVHPDIVRWIGNGSMAAGRKVLAAFVARARHQHRQGSDAAPSD